GHLADQVVSLPAKQRMVLDGDMAVQIAGWAALFPHFALTRDPDRLPLMHTGRDLDGDFSLFASLSSTTAGWAMVLNHAPASLAVRAGGDHPEHAAKALLGHLAASAAGLADHRL